MGFVIKAIKDWLDSSQHTNGPHGPSAERELFTPTWWQTLTGRGSDGRQYTVDAADLEKLRPVFVLDERAVKNRKLRDEARARRRSAGHMLFVSDAPPLTFVPEDARDGAFPDWLVARAPAADAFDDGDDFVPPKAELLPAVPRAAPNVDIDDCIIFPSGEDNGHRDG